MMRYSLGLWTIMAAAVSSCAAFAPTFGTRSCSSNTKLYISSWGPEGSPYKQSRRAQQERKLENPEEKIQSYLEEPGIIDVKDDIDGTCVVSGFCTSPERTDQEVFDLLNPNDERNAFFFDKILAFVPDVKFAKKRLLSRSARYSGLLDSLDFMEAVEGNDLPTREQLDGVKNWLHVIEDNHVANLQKATQLAIESPSLVNVAFLLTNTNGTTFETSKLLEPLKQPGVKKRLSHAILAVGALTEEPEGQEYYKLAKWSDPNTTTALPEDAEFSRVEALRLLTDCFQLTKGHNVAFFASEVYNENATEARLIRGLREAGYIRAQESDHILQDGVAKYEKAIDEWKNGNPNAKRGNYKNWWEAPEFQETVKKSEEKRAKEDEAVKDEKQQEIEKIAREWAKREYFRQSMAETTTVDEETFVKDVWDRALFEGDLRYRQAHGETLDEESELADFKAIQKRKKETMLKRAKEELKEILDEVPAGIDEDDMDDDDE